MIRQTRKARECNSKHPKNENETERRDLETTDKHPDTTGVEPHFSISAATSTHLKRKVRFDPSLPKKTGPPAFSEGIAVFGDCF